MTIYVNPSEGDEPHLRLHALTQADEDSGISLKLPILRPRRTDVNAADRDGRPTLQFDFRFTSNFENSYLPPQKALSAYASR